MTSVYDVILRVSFKVSFPHLYVIRFGKAGCDCVTKGNIFMCARHFFF